MSKMVNIEALHENVKCRAESDIKNNNICGDSIAVISPYETLYKTHFGTLSAKDNTPLDDFVLFRMASITKPMFNTESNKGLNNWVVFIVCFCLTTA